MNKKQVELLKKKCGKIGYDRLLTLKNPSLNSFIHKWVSHCNPENVFICTDSEKDTEYLRKQSLKNREEKRLATKGHTVHFDGYFDQARDKANTKYLLPPGALLSSDINITDKKKGLAEINSLLKNSMLGKEMYVLFFCLAPLNSPFSISCVQITDSGYVAHSEKILVRSGYEQFKKLGGSTDYFRFVHSAGELTESNISKNFNKRRVYIDIQENIVFSTNTQYAGNTVGLKKLAMRLAIHKASHENWLTEHMFIMGVRGRKGRTTYFTGAFPSACGKTATAMLEDETIVGDDIAYIKNIKGRAHAANVECGIFGIIMNVNSKDDPSIYKALNTSGEVIFSNILVTKNNKPYWLGKDGAVPKNGANYSGKWFIGKTDERMNVINASHKNARYTLSISSLSNRDKNADNPGGVPVSGVIYGGRDSDTTVPVEETFSWEHGIITKGAMLESETTSATLGQEGVRKFNLMSNLDFLSIPLSKYISCNLNFARKLKVVPRIFGVNYFLKDVISGEYLNGIKDKHVWLKWMELRVNNNVDALKTPSGHIPLYKDLRKLFKSVLHKNYSREDYIRQFSIRIPQNLAKIERILKIYQNNVDKAPVVLIKTINAQKKRLQNARKIFGDYPTPDRWEN